MSGLENLAKIISYIVFAIEKNCNSFWSVLKRVCVSDVLSVCVRCVECVSDVLSVYQM